MSQRYCISDPTAALIDRLIMQQIQRNGRVLDLGCGDGRLLCRLRDELGCSILGIELDHQQVVESISKGVSLPGRTMTGFFTRSASLSTVKWCDIDGLVLSNRAASSPADISPCPSKRRISRRVESASARNT